MDTDHDRLDALERKLARLARRVGELEGAPARKRKAAASAPLGFIEELRSRRSGRHKGKGISGVVVYGGAVLVGEREYLAMWEHAAPDVDEIDPAAIARTLGALGHPARLVLLRALVKRPQSSQQLQGLLDVSSPGQLYHHLKELVSTGVVTQTRRSQYEVSERHILPVLAILAAASDLAPVHSDVETQGAPRS
jgi:DNA-binding transcriptional ArsR family regulator